MIDWTTNKQRRVSYLSYGAEILAGADADDRGHHLRTSLRALAPDENIKYTMNVDSRGLYDASTTIHNGKEYRLRQTVVRLLNRFLSKELDVLRWIPGQINIADALTKRNPATQKLLNKVPSDAILDIPLDKSFELDSETWT